MGETSCQFKSSTSFATAVQRAVDNDLLENKNLFHIQRRHFESNVTLTTLLCVVM